MVDTPFFMHNGFYYDRDFEFFYDLDTQRTGNRVYRHRGPLIPQIRRCEADLAAPRTMALAEQCLEYLYKERFFLYVDTWDPHEPWDPPEWYVKRYKKDYDGRIVNPPYGDWRAAGLSSDDLETAHACYAGEITMVDRWIGRLLERVETLGIGEETGIGFLSDHGFYFGERGCLGKMFMRKPIDDPFERVWLRSPLYEELVHIPLIIHVPGMPARRVPTLVSAVDVMPTVLELFGIASPPSCHGQSVAASISGGKISEREFVVSAMSLANPGAEVRVVDDILREVEAFQPATITTTKWSMLYSSEGEPVELYNLERDPQQQANVAGNHEDVVAELHSRYVELLEYAGASSAHLEPRRRL